MPEMLDELMEDASQALAEMDYARCEALCLDALAQARAEQDWVMVQRVLLPLQEARRQRRQTAIDGWITLGISSSNAQDGKPGLDHSHGCVVLTHPSTAEDAADADQHARASAKSIELLYADNPADRGTWRITTYRGPSVTADVPAPDRAWIGQATHAIDIAPPTPAHWFMRASEALGNAAMDAITEPPGTVEYFDALAAALHAVGDHELLHQRLADAARALHEAQR